MMDGFGPGEKVYPVVEIAAVLEAMSLEGVSHQHLLARMRVSKAALTSPRTRISAAQLLDCFAYAAEHAPDPFFAYRAGLRLHVTAFGAYGFALLSSTNYRQTMKFAETYHRMVTPLTDLQFTEANGSGVWSFLPIAHERIDARVYRFVVEMGFGITLSLHRDVMGQSVRASCTSPIHSRRMPGTMNASSRQPSSSARSETTSFLTPPGSMARRCLRMRSPMRPFAICANRNWRSSRT
jgi:hypothetical protein